MTIDMKLQKKDVELLKSRGYSESDIPQIQEAIERSTYNLHLADAPYTEIRKLTALGAYRKLGREKFLSGISRSAFHWSASRETKDPKYNIGFDSSILFK